MVGSDGADDGLVERREEHPEQDREQDLHLPPMRQCERRVLVCPLLGGGHGFHEVVWCSFQGPAQRPGSSPACRWRSWLVQAGDRPAECLPRPGARRPVGTIERLHEASQLLAAQPFHLLAALHPRGGRAHEDESSVPVIPDPLHECMLLHPIDDPRQVRHGYVHEGGQSAHGHRPMVLEQHEHVRCSAC